MIARKIGPVLAVGCTAVIKVPAETPYTNLAIMEVSPTALRILLHHRDLLTVLAGKTCRCTRRCIERDHLRRQYLRDRRRIEHEPLDKEIELYGVYESRQDTRQRVFGDVEEDELGTWRVSLSPFLCRENMG